MLVRFSKVSISISNIVVIWTLTKINLIVKGAKKRKLYLFILLFQKIFKSDNNYYSYITFIPIKYINPVFMRKIRFWGCPEKILEQKLLVL